MKLTQFKECIGHPEHGFGFLPDPVKREYKSFRLHPASMLHAEVIPEAASIDQFAPPIWLQGRTGSCMGHGTAGAVTTTFAAKGMPLRRPADPRMVYTLARASTRENPDEALQDVGTWPGAMTFAVGSWGIALEDEVEGGRSATDADYSLWLEEHINDEPKLGELEATNARPLVNINWIDATGSSLRDQICSAIAGGYAVMAAIDASSTAFQSFDGIGTLGYTGDSPNHWVYFTAYRTVGGEKHILMRNSWGFLWTPDGKAWCNEDFMRGMFSVLVANLGL